MKRLTVSVCLWDLRARRGVYNRNIPRIRMGTPSPHSDPRTNTPSHFLQRLWGPRKLGPGKEGAQFAWNLSPVLTIGIFPFCSWFVCQYLRKHWIDKEAVNLSLSNNTNKFEVNIESWNCLHVFHILKIINKYSFQLSEIFHRTKFISCKCQARE